MTTSRKHKIELTIGILLLLGLALLTYSVGTDRIVSFIGVENTYVVMFVIALVGGMTLIGGVSYTASILTFVSGGADPLLVGILAGLGTSVGDSAYFLVSRRGHQTLSDGWLKNKITQVKHWLSTHSDRLKFLFIYLYIGFTPLPNDPVTISLGLSGEKAKLVLPALILGDVTLALILSFFGNELSSLL